MQDINGNGQPDDEWYELKGSETGIDGTIQDYEVTYYRPAPRAHTPWVDSEGNSGSVDMNAYHGQEYYYPNWIKEDSYTLYGTRLTLATIKIPLQDIGRITLMSGGMWIIWVQIIW